MRIKITLEKMLVRYHDLFAKFGINDDNIIEHFKNWRSYDPKNLYDYIWYIFNVLIKENADYLEKNPHEEDALKDFYNRNFLIYSKMLDFRRRIEQKKANEVHALYNYNRLCFDLENDNSKVLSEVAFITDGECNSCKHLTNKRVSINLALKNKIIPYDSCERENKSGCICSMCLVAKRDKNGRLIRE